MMSIRAVIQDKPAIAWGVVGALFVIGALLFFRGFGSSPQADLAENITVRFEDTSDDVQMRRGQLEMELIQVSATRALDPTVGINNPKTGKPTGFPTDRKYWERIITEINAERSAAKTGSRQGVPASR